MAPAPARRRGNTRNNPDGRLFNLVLAQKFRRVSLSRAANFANHNDRMGLVIVQEHVEDFDEIRAFDRIAANSDAARLAKASRCGLVNRLIGERSRARDHANVTFAMDMAGHDPDLAFVRRDDARTVRPHKPGL